MVKMIRRALISDIPDVVEIEDNSFRVPWPDFLFKSHLSNPGFLVYDDGKVLGYIIVGSSEDKRKAHLQSIAVQKNYRRQGIASKLMDWCIDLLRLYGFERIVLEVREKNIPARYFYLSKGFSIDGITEGYYYDDNAILMGKDL